MKLFGKAICWGLSLAVAGMLAGYWGWCQAMAEDHPGWAFDPNVVTMPSYLLADLGSIALKGFCFGIFGTYIWAWIKRKTPPPLPKQPVRHQEGK
jgi:hypothetical protein